MFSIQHINFQLCTQL